jgi:hypothetical protein
MIAPAELDITIFQGASFYLPFQLLEDDGDPTSLNGATIRGKVRNDLDDAAPIISFTGTVVSGDDGEGELTLTAAQTAAIALPASTAKKRPLTQYLWDFEVEFADGYVQRMAEGNCYVSPEVSK